MSSESDLLEAFEVHSPEQIRRVLASGVSPLNAIKGKRPIDCLIEAYLRSARFADCLRVMMEAGARVGDELLESLLLDDALSLKELIHKSPERIGKHLDLLCAFTSCSGVTPLHICAEYNAVRCARVLIETGADVNAPADVKSDGTGGHTPIFHTVNSIHNFCRPMMELLTNAGADLDMRIESILWGDSFDWETVVFDATPLSYAQCGLYRQFHRREEDVSSNVDYLYKARYGRHAPIRNVPNQYLKS